ncbi:hypothetical protein TL16_g09384 [Triparma laevis f. inornata]|uniref:Uncharacterized protein n=1 Tax=Triparma laevis f. inornata TaxID=1714386 RepID=A0A9W7EJ35_9STRA|nr:hypothetical protein TL16_g09384 [Triparma laevis f. inornata]
MKALPQRSRLHVVFVDIMVKGSSGLHLLSGPAFALTDDAGGKGAELIFVAAAFWTGESHWFFSCNDGHVLQILAFAVVVEGFLPPAPTASQQTRASGLSAKQPTSVHQFAEISLITALSTAAFVVSQPAHAFGPDIASMISPSTSTPPAIVKEVKQPLKQISGAEQIEAKIEAILEEKSAATSAEGKASKALSETVEFKNLAAAKQRSLDASRVATTIPELKKQKEAAYANERKAARAADKKLGEKQKKAKQKEKVRVKKEIESRKKQEKREREQTKAKLEREKKEAAKEKERFKKEETLKNKKNADEKAKQEAKVRSEAEALKKKEEAVKQKAAGAKAKEIQKQNDAKKKAADANAKEQKAAADKAAKEFEKQSAAKKAESDKLAKEKKAKADKAATKAAADKKAVEQEKAKAAAKAAADKKVQEQEKAKAAAAATAERERLSKQTKAEAEANAAASR